MGNNNSNIFNQFMDENAVKEIEEIQEVDNLSPNVNTFDDVEEVEEIDDESKPAENEEIDSPVAEEEEVGGISGVIYSLYEEGVIDIPEDKEYDDSPEGFKELISDNIQLGIQEWRSSLPEVANQLIEFIEAGGDVKDFVENITQSVNYSDIDIDDEDNQRLLITEHLGKQGLTEYEIEEALESFESANVLEKQAKLAQRILAKEQNEQIARTVEMQKQRELEIRQQQEEAAEQFRNRILTTEEIGGFEVPKAERQKFYDYLTKPVDKQGRTKYQIEDSEEERLKMAYYKFKNFDFGDVERKVKTTVTSTLRERLENYKDRNASSKTENTVVRSKASEKLEIPDVFSNRRRQ